MLSKSTKENIDPNKKLNSIRNRSLIPKIQLETLRNQESPPRSYPESFVSINIFTSKSPSVYREPSCVSPETVFEAVPTEKNFLCTTCSISTNHCLIV